jgi:hypothetical protein
MSKYFLYYAGYNNVTEKEQIGVATSSDFITWKWEGDLPKIPLKSQGVSDEVQTSNPCVLKHDGLYKMWYQGKSKEGLLSVCYAESKDGIDWKPYDKPVLSSKISEKPEFREGIQHPHVIFDTNKNRFVMWCVVYKKGLTSIGYCESVNGLVWTDLKFTSLVSNDPEHKYFYPFVVFEKGSYRMWYTERVGKKWTVSHTRSKDGITWDMSKNKPVVSTFYNSIFIFLLEAVAKITKYVFEIPIYGIGSPFVWKDKEKYNLIGHSVGPRGKLFISLYESVDGIKWVKKINNILPKPDTSWNEFFQADPFLYVEE